MNVQPVLETRSLVVEYERGVRALAGVDLAIREGEVVAVIGPSGAGKSTLLRAMNRLTTPTSGQILLRGEDITRSSGRSLRTVRRRVGMIFQQFNLVPQLTVLENVLVGWIGGAPPLARIPALWRQFPARAQDRAKTCLNAVGVLDRAQAKACELSGGQQQRVAIARVLMQNPAAILADEPIASLDPASAALVLRTLREISQSRGVPVVINLHQVEAAREYATRIVGLRRGRVIFDLPPDLLGHAELAALYDTPQQLTEADPPAPVVVARVRGGELVG